MSNFHDINVNALVIKLSNGNTINLLCHIEQDKLADVLSEFVVNVFNNDLIDYRLCLTNIIKHIIYKDISYMFNRSTRIDRVMLAEFSCGDLHHTINFESGDYMVRRYILFYTKKCNKDSIKPNTNYTILTEYEYTISGLNYNKQANFGEIYQQINEKISTMMSLKFAIHCVNSLYIGVKVIN